MTELPRLLDRWLGILSRPWLLAALYLVLVSAKLARHEMWRDELHAWAIARASHGAADLFHNIRYEGHPGLWYGCLYLLSCVSRSPGAMQVLHALAGTAMVYLIARFAPWSRLEKVLVPFGYFTFFEYSTISRGYVLTFLALLAACAVLCSRLPPRRRYITLGLTIALLAQTEVYGLLLAGPVAVVATVDLLRRPPSDRSWTGLALAGLLLLASAGLAIRTIAPPQDSTSAKETWHKSYQPALAQRTVATVYRAYAPLPPLKPTFWNGIQLDGNQPLQMKLALLFIGLALVMLAPSLEAILLYALGSLLLGGFMYGRFLGSIRHHGHFFMLLVSAWWLACAARQQATGAGRLRRLHALGATALFVVLCTVQAVGAGIATYYDWRLPFSASAETASFIRARGFGDLVLVGDLDSLAVPVAQLLNRPMHLVASGTTAPYVTLNGPGRRWPSRPELLQAIERLRQQSDRDLLLVLSYSLGRQLPAGYSPLGDFQNSICVDERYWLYRVSRG